MIPDLFLLNLCEHFVVWVQSWTGWSIASIMKTSFGLYGVCWCTFLIRASDDVWWKDLVGLLVTLPVIILSSLDQTLNQKQRYADETGQIVPSITKDSKELSFSRCALMACWMIGVCMTPDILNIFINIVAFALFFFGLYVRNMDVWPRTGRKVKKLKPLLVER